MILPLSPAHAYFQLIKSFQIKSCDFHFLWSFRTIKPAKQASFYNATTRKFPSPQLHFLNQKLRYERSLEVARNNMASAKNTFTSHIWDPKTTKKFTNTLRVTMTQIKYQPTMNILSSGAPARKILSC